MRKIPFDGFVRTQDIQGEGKNKRTGCHGSSHGVNTEVRIEGVLSGTLHRGGDCHGDSNQTAGQHDHPLAKHRPVERVTWIVFPPPNHEDNLAVVS